MTTNNREVEAGGATMNFDGQVRYRVVRYFDGDRGVLRLNGLSLSISKLKLSTVALVGVRRGL